MVLLQELTEEEKSLVSTYCRLWNGVTLSTSRLDRNQVQDVIQGIYKILGLDHPNIHYCDGPHALAENTKGRFQNLYYCQDGMVFPTLEMARIHELRQDFVESLGICWNGTWAYPLKQVEGGYIDESLANVLLGEFLDDLPLSWRREKHISWISPRGWYTAEACMLDFYFSVAQRTLRFPYDVPLWQAYKHLIQVCSWFIAFESDCYLCETPKAFLFERKIPTPSSMQFINGEHLKITVPSWDGDEM